MITLGYRKPKGLLRDVQSRRITPKSAWLRKLERSQRVKPRPVKSAEPQWLKDALRECCAIESLNGRWCVRT